MTYLSFLIYQSSEKQKKNLELKAFFLFIYSSSFESFKFNSYKSSSERDIVVKALFVYPSQKEELSL
jgi:hypothetical protein